MPRRPVAFVSGGKRGIGKGIAVCLAEQGYDLALNDLEHDSVADETIRQLNAIGAKTAFVAGDIADLAGHGRIVSAAFDAFGTVDCMVNNAGVSVAARGDILDIIPESFDRVMGINLRGTFFLTQAFAKRMLTEKRGAADPARSIITVSSYNAIGVSVDRAEYNLSKTGLSMMVKLFAVRLAPHGIGIYEVRPGIIRSDMTAVAKEKYDRLIAQGLTPIPRWGEPADVGKAVAMLASGALGFSVGEAIHVDGGLSVPRL
jgi:NAD(P)-dependent dehydrogenase (short-subunit alcohol dehydrogenase family)